MRDKERELEKSLFRTAHEYGLEDARRYAENHGLIMKKLVYCMYPIYFLLHLKQEIEERRMIRKINGKD